MEIVVTGATGFIGHALVRRLMRDGHHVTAWVRSPYGARSRLPFEVDLVDIQDSDGLDEAMGEADAVINLAGEPVAMTRWTPAKRAALVASRVGVTQSLVGAIARSPQRPKVLVSASAVGYYGDTGDQEVDESAPRGNGFLADLCAAWEAEAGRATALGVRVVTPRIGIVLGRGGGALETMLPAFRAGVGGPIAGGQQWMSWIHLDDLIELLVRAVHDPAWAGPINAVAPAPVRNAEFTVALGAAVRRPAVLPVPGIALKLAFGQSAEVVTKGQRVSSAALTRLGFAFRHPKLTSALADCV